jgi:hypothetical protein
MRSGTVIFAFSTVSARETMMRPSRSIFSRNRRDSMVLPAPMTAVSAIRWPAWIAVRKSRATWAWCSVSKKPTSTGGRARR